MISDTRVAIHKSAARSYPSAPFSPGRKYPEYRFGDVSGDGDVYEAVRNTLRMLKMDESNYGTPRWNPLGEIIRPGDKVVVKPNLVLDFNSSGETTDCLITHASVLRPIIDYVLIALKGKGRVIVADSPHGNANFEKIREAAGLNDLQEYYLKNNIELEILDLRKYEYGHGENGFLEKRKVINGDPEGYAEIDLGEDSAFIDLPHLENLYGADYDRKEITRHHTKTINRYLVARTFLTADVIINVPKLKTHKKIGTTLNLKSLIGINGDKNYLPHFRVGDALHGGDEFPAIGSKREWWKLKLKRAAQDSLLGNNDNKRIKLFKTICSVYATTRRTAISTAQQPPRISEGNWHGNDTVYRTVYDLSKIVALADSRGIMHKTPQRRFLFLIDGIVAGEKQGPLAPSPKPCGVVIGGRNPVAVDLVATRLMGFNTERMVVFSRLETIPPDHPLQSIAYGDIQIASNNDEWNRNIFDSNDRYLALCPHSGWRNYLDVFDAKEAEENKSEIKLMAVGDISLKTAKPTNPFQGVVGILNDGDVVFGNLETALCDGEPSAQKAVSISAPSWKAKYLSEAGFDVLNLANNHITDCGIEGLTNTVKVLRQNGLHAIGINEQEHDCNSAIINNNGIAIGFLGYKEIRYSARKSNAPINSLTPLSIIEDIRRLLPKCDVVAVSLHWGIENVYCPSPAQIKMARSLIDAGADIVLGHHAHVIQGIERYKGGIIAYSLGNFQFEYNVSGRPPAPDCRTDYSIVLSVRIGKRGVTSYEVIPIFIDANYSPRPPDSGARNDILNLVNGASQSLAVNALSRQHWLDKIAPRYLSDSITSWKVRIHRYGKLHLAKCCIWFLSPFVLRCLFSVVKQKLFRKRNSPVENIAKSNVETGAAILDKHTHIADKKHGMELGEKYVESVKS